MKALEFSNYSTATPFLQVALGALSFGWTLVRLTTNPPLNPIIRNTAQVAIAATALHSAHITKAVINEMWNSPLSASLLLRVYASWSGTAIMVVSLVALEHNKILKDSSLPRFTQVILSAATVSAAGKMLLGSSPVPLFAKAAVVYGAIELSKTGYSMFQTAYMEKADAIEQVKTDTDTDTDTDTEVMEITLST